MPGVGGPLEKEYHIYVLLVKERNDVIPFMASNDGGSFCSKCPVVVLDNDVFARGVVAGRASDGLIAALANAGRLIEDVTLLVNAKRLSCQRLMRSRSLSAI